MNFLDGLVDVDVVLSVAMLYADVVSKTTKMMWENLVKAYLNVSFKFRAICSLSFKYLICPSDLNSEPNVLALAPDVVDAVSFFVGNRL